MGTRNYSTLPPVCAVLALACAGVLLVLEQPATGDCPAPAPAQARLAPAASAQFEPVIGATLEVRRSVSPPLAEFVPCGEVRDGDGQGIGSLVIVHRLGDERCEVGVSDAAGRFEWPSASLGGELWVEHAHWVCVRGARVDAPEEAQARTLIVAPATTLRGEVHSAGVRLPHARVGVLLDGAGAAAPLWPGASATTREGGAFEVAGIPRGVRLSVRVSCAGFSARSFELDSAPEHGVELELEPLRADFGVLRGMVLTHVGAPADEHTSVVWGRAGTRCRSDGSFELALRFDPGDAPIVVSARGASPVCTRPAWEHVSSGLALELRAGPPLEGLVGWIRDSDGASELKGLVVELHRETPAGAPLARVRSDAAGRYEFRGLEHGEYWVRAVRGGASASAGPISSGGRAPELVISR